MTDKELREAYPAIAWDEPLQMTISSDEGTSYYGFACRYCIGQKGVKAADVIAGKPDMPVWQTRRGALAHIRTHGGPDARRR